MMVLLVLISVGLLSLSSVVLRSTESGQAELEAQANARLALSLAIGQLQTAAGPDQRITAPASLLDANNPSAVTGVWESLQLLPEGGQDLAFSKQRGQTGLDPDGEFVTWLNSDSYRGAPNISNPFDGSAEQRVRLLEVPQGTNDRQPTGSTLVEASVLPVNEGSGGIAWATIDESVKARFDLPRAENLAELGESANNIVRDRLRNPERLGTEFIAGIERAATEAEAGRIATFESGALWSGSTPGRFRELFNDVTPWSLGVYSNPVEGGLKKDLTAAFESPNDPTADLFLYSQEENQLAAGEPYMSTLRDYYRLSLNGGNPEDEINVSVPQDYSPFTVDRFTRDLNPEPTPVDGIVVAPVVSRVNLVFSLFSHRGHDHWPNTLRRISGDPRRTEMVYLVYTPVVTLYNPYNSPLVVNNLEVSFKNLPLGFQFFRNGVAQTRDLALLSQFHGTYDGETSHEDEFRTTLTSEPGASSQSEITLAPGESRLFGLNHSAGTRWRDMWNFLFGANERGSSKTLNIATAAGYNQGFSGYIVDWLVPRVANPTADVPQDVNVLGVRTSDTVNVSIAPVVPTQANGTARTNFTVNISASVNGSSRSQPIGSYRYTYAEPGDSVAQAQARLREAFEQGAHPELGQISYPYQREKAFNYNEIFQPDLENRPVEDWTGPKQFAVFTMATRTSNDSLYPTKPGRETSFVHNVLDMDITKAHPAQMPMEFSFLPVLSSPGSTNNVGSIEVWSKDDPRTFFFSGWTVDKGFTNYPTIEVPRTPPTNLTQFRNANLASSGHLPMPGQTVGDSHAHPMIPADRAIGDPVGRGGSDAFDYLTLDHAWMANNTLYDNFFLSGIRSDDEMRLFLEGEPVPYNHRTEAHLPEGQSVSSAEELYRNSAEGWTATAAFQLKKGPFNVNSTSVAAWRALLLSSVNAEIPIFNPAANQAESVTASFAAFPRQLDSPSGSIDLTSNFPDNQLRWAGFRDLQEEEINSLAEEIVEHVRSRGPFTSLSEFLNRSLVDSADERSLRGVLEQAILTAGLNETAASFRIVTEQEAAEYEYANPAAAVGDTEAAAAAFLTQSDLMSVIGNSLTVRGDTFVVRAYGDAKDRSGRILATARCEAVVQRIPDFVEPEDHLGAKPADFARGDDFVIESAINERFGRRFVVRSFRWLSSEEV